MRLRLLHISLQVLLLSVLSGARTEAQNLYSLDWNLSQLRGNWEFHTFRDKWTLVFDDDHKMLFDREPVDYSLVPGAIRIQDGGGSTDYPYKLSGNGLTLTLPDGSDRTYRITDPGEAEKLIHGTLYASVSPSSSRENISFDGDHMFMLQTSQSKPANPANPAAAASTGQASALVEKRGVYRVEGELVVLAFDDSTTMEARVHVRDEDGTITSVMIDNRLFVAEEPAAPSLLPPVQLPMASAPPVQPDIVPIYVPQSPPAYSISTPPPAVATAPASSDKKSTKSAEPARDFGSTRGKRDGR